MIMTPCRGGYVGARGGNGVSYPLILRKNPFLKIIL